MKPIPSPRIALITGILAFCLFAVSRLFAAQSAGARPSALTPPPTPLPNPGYYGIIAHRDDCPNSSTGGLHVEGNPNIVIPGGSVHSDACLSLSGSTSTTAANGNIEYVTDYTGGGAVSPAPIQVPYTLPIEVDDFIDCSGLPISSSDGNGTINPGIYMGIAITGNESLVMNPGLYCFDGNFTINGNSTSTVTGNGVTIYMHSGDLNSNGNTSVVLSAPQTLPAEPNDGYLGLLIVMGSENAGEVGLIGNQSSSYHGTIYARHEDSLIELGGTGDLVSCYNGSPCFETQLIAGTVLLHGDSVMHISPPKIYSLPLEMTGPAVASPGDLLTYTLTVTNIYNFASVFDVVLTDTLPTGTEFITATLPFTRTGDTLTWKMDPLPLNTIWQVKMVVQVPVATTLDTIVNEAYRVTGEGAYASVGEPITTTIDLPSTPSPTPTETPPTPTAPTPTATPDLTPTPTGTPAPTEDIFTIFLPVILQNPE